MRSVRISACCATTSGSRTSACAAQMLKSSGRWSATSPPCQRGSKTSAYLVGDRPTGPEQAAAAQAREHESGDRSAEAGASGSSRRRSSAIWRPDRQRNAARYPALGGRENRAEKSRQRTARLLGKVAGSLSARRI